MWFYLQNIIRIMNYYRILTYSRNLVYSLLLVSLIFTGATSNALASGEGYSQLLRNTTIESTYMNKGLVEANEKGKFAKNKNTKLTDAQISKKSKELEGVFLSVMLEPIFPEGKESNLYGGGNSAGIFRTLMVQEYGKVLSDAGGIGIAAGVEKQMKRQ